MQDPDRCRELMRLLDGLTDQQVRACGVEALRRWRRRASQPRTTDPLEASALDTFAMHGDFGREFSELLLATHTTTRARFDANQLKEVFIDDDAMGKEWMRGIVEFLWWLARSGFAVELQRDVIHGSQTRRYPLLMRLTRRGIRLLDSTEDNPLLPGVLDRIRDRCPGLPDGVIALLVDARACYDHSLMRPAVVLMGVAYELAIEHVVDVLATKNLVAANTPSQKAGERIKRIKALLATPQASAVLSDSDDRTAASAAYDFAEHLRQRRNDAAHTTPAFDFDHADETDEFLVSAGRHLPALWSLAR
jgi:hypothetical protein